MRRFQNKVFDVYRWSLYLHEAILIIYLLGAMAQIIDQVASIVNREQVALVKLQKGQ